MADHTTVARPYARAVFEFAREAGDLDGWAAALAAAAAVIDDADARAFLARPEMRAAERAEFVEGIGSGIDGGALLATDGGRNLLALLSENDRLAALPEIAARFEALKTRAENKVKVTLVSATAVDEQQAGTFRSVLEKRLGRKVDLTLEVDDALLGGAVLRAEDMVIDGSVRSRLARLADSLSG